MAFPRKHLNDDEQLVLDLHPHWIFLAPSVGSLVVAVIVALLVIFGLNDGTFQDVSSVVIGVIVLAALVWFGVRYAKWLTTEFAVSNHRVMSRWGVLSKHGRQIPLERINTVEFSQTLFERMLGAGDLGIESASDGGREEFSDIRHPDEVQREIYVQIRANVDRVPAGFATQPAAAVAEQPAQTSGTVADQLTKLDELRRNGVLSEAEFQAQKARLLQG
ncbi:MAG TPA: PH domain-containing protein [Acidimicrobiales bacterium]|nr:PH domain-containing protein [Acidimicrobiales bacterium]